MYEGRGGVRHITWGAKSVAGYATPRDVLVFLVDTKKPDLAERAPERIPKKLAFDTALGRIEVETDVRHVARGVHHAGAVSPGFHCGVRAGTNVGSLGCLTTPNGGTFAIVSGHVALTKGTAVTATTTSGATVPLGAVLSVRNDADIDAARVGPVPPSSINGLGDASTTVRDLDESDTRLVVHLSVSRGTLVATIETVSEPAVFVDPATLVSHSMNALIRLDQAITQHGDSGAPATDVTGLLIGFVEGIADGRTYLIPAGRAIDGVS
jgi:hypothetical protein